MKGLRSGALAALAVVAAGCHHAPPRTRSDDLPPPASESRAGASKRSAGPVSAPVASAAAPVAPERARAVAAAAGLVGRRTIVVDGVDYGMDCAALVRAAYERAGHPLPPDARDAAALYALAKRRGLLAEGRRAAPGDLVFFAEREGGRPAHVGLVESVDPDGTAIVFHRVARGVMRLRVNLAWPGRQTDPSTGRHVNDVLLVGARAVPAGSLVVAAADLLRAPARR